MKQLLSNVCSVLAMPWKFDVASMQTFVFYNVSSLLPALPHIFFFSCLLHVCISSYSWWTTVPRNIKPEEVAFPWNDILLKSIKQEQGHRSNLYSWMIEWRMTEKQSNKKLSSCKARYKLLVQGAYCGQNMASEVLVWTYTSIGTERKKSGIFVESVFYWHSLTTGCMLSLMGYSGDFSQKLRKIFFSKNCTTLLRVLALHECGPLNWQKLGYMS